MEAASVAAETVASRTPLDAARSFISRYGLILVLVAGPMYYAIHDLAVDGNLVRIGCAH